MERAKNARMPKRETDAFTRMNFFLKQVQHRLGLTTQAAMARELHMSESTFKNRLRKPGNLSWYELLAIQRVARRAGMELTEEVSVL